MRFTGQKVLALSSLALLSLCAAPGARADFTMTIQQVGSNVVGTGSGTIDLSGLTFEFSGNGGGLVWGTFPGGGSAIGLGTFGGAVDAYSGTLTGSTTTFGSGSGIAASSGTGDAFDIAPGGTTSGYANVYVPKGYVSGSALSDSATWDSTTIAALGLTPGTYTYSWNGVVGDDDTVTLIIGAAGTPTPEPSSFALVASGVLGLAGVVRRRR